MTATLPDSSAASLRTIAEELPVPEGFRVEIIGGTIVMSPTPAGKHGRMVRLLDKMITPYLPDGYDVEVNLGVEKAPGEDDYTIPDLFVAPEDVLDTWDSEVPADEVIMVAEVVSTSNPANDRVAKVEHYAVARIPLYLLVDPGLKQLTVYSDPAEGHYRAVHSVPWGEKLTLPEPLPVVVDSSRFPSIDGRPRRGR